MSDLEDVLDFCPGCFATNEDGSWGHTCDDHYCYNCGAQGTVKLPRWAVRSIREQASWVGKRYYPHDEDREAAEEIAALREIAPPAAPEAPQPVEPVAWKIESPPDEGCVEWVHTDFTMDPETAAIYERRGCRARAVYLLPPAHQPGADAELVERLREALERIVRWSEAYPVDIFPEPDLKTARVLLEAGGITLDAVSASAMRHVVSGVGQIARAALEASGADHHDAGTGET